MRALALGGIAGPALLTIVVTVLGALRPGFSHAQQFISELGVAGTPNAALMNYAGFVPTGLLLAAFGIALACALPRGRLVLIAAALVILYGLGIAASGIVSCDAGCPLGAGSVENIVHNTIAPVSFLCLIIAMALLGVRFRSLPAWRHLSRFSLFAGAVALVLLVVLAGSLDSRAFTGLWQRLLLAVLFTWSAVVGIGAFRRPASSAPAA